MPAHRPQLSRPHQPATSEQLDASARITGADIAHASSTWEKDAPPALRQLLNAIEDRPPRTRKPGTADSG